MVQESPAITSIFPFNASKEEKIKFLEDQIVELKQQKICYDVMIRDRKFAIRQIQANQSDEARRSLFQALISPKTKRKTKRKSPKKVTKKRKKPRKRSK